MKKPAPARAANAPHIWGGLKARSGGEIIFALAFVV